MDTFGTANKSSRAGRARNTPLPEAMLIDADAAAALVNCSTRHWRRMVDEGKAPKPIRVGTLVRWNKQTVLEWITDGCPAFKASRGRRDHRL